MLLKHFTRHAEKYVKQLQFVAVHVPFMVDIPNELWKTFVDSPFPIRSIASSLPANEYLGE